MMRVKAKKALGQHFLRDLSIAERIADTLSELYWRSGRVWECLRSSYFARGMMFAS